MKRCRFTFAALLSGLVVGTLLLQPVHAELKLIAIQVDEKPAAAKVVGSTKKTDDAAPAAVSAAKRKLSDTVQFHMPDGDVLVGKMLAKQITVTTEFGILTVPTDQIRSFVPGLSSRPELLKKIEDAIAKLASADQAERDQAHKQLSAMGPGVEGEVRKFKGDANAERAKHVGTLLAEFEKKQAEAEKLGEGVERAWVREDTVVTTDFTVLGKISPSTFQISSQYGVLTTGLAKIERATRTGLGREGFSKTVDVSGQHLMQRSYKKSAVQVQRGDRVTVTASGQITMSPWGSSTRSSPDGSTQWGNHMGFPAGCLVAKIGNSGKPFRIGSKTTFTAKTSGMIYFGVSMNSSYASQVFPGSYKVKTKVSPSSN
jgi:hypothetical protein